MYRMQLGFALAAAIGAGGWWTPGQELASVHGGAATRPPGGGSAAAPRLQGDPADSLYRAAREALNRRDYRRAADSSPRSGQLPEVGLRAPTRSTGRRSRSTASAGRAAAGGARRARRAARALPRGGHPRATPPRWTAASRASSRAGRPQAAESGQRTSRGQAAEPPMPPDAAGAPGPAGTTRLPSRPTPPARRRRRCEDDDDDTKIAALNALHPDGRATGPCRCSAEGARPTRRRRRSASGEGGVPGLPEGRRRAPRTSCCDRPHRPRSPRCGSRRCSGSRRSGTERAVGALDSILRTTKDRDAPGEGGLRPVAARTVPRARQALRAYAERTDAPEARAREGDLLDRPERRARERGLPAGAVRPAQGRGAEEEGALLGLADGRRRRTTQLAPRRGPRPDPAGRDAEAGALLGRPGRCAARGPRRALRHDRRPRDARAAHLRATPSATSPRRWTS